MNHDSYSDAYLRDILSNVRRIALVGASNKPVRPSYHVAQVLAEKGYEVIPVNPGLAGQVVDGRLVYATIADIPGEIDMVDVFRAVDQVPGVVDEAIAAKAKVVWMQLDIRDDVSAAKAEAAGIRVVMNRCPAIEIPRLGM
jgi:predicted CoA-binding protein